jgi:hypothetical protein
VDPLRGLVTDLDVVLTESVEAAIEDVLGQRPPG